MIQFQYVFKGSQKFILFSHSSFTIFSLWDSQKDVLLLKDFVAPEKLTVTTPRLFSSVLAATSHMSFSKCYCNVNSFSGGRPCPWTLSPYLSERACSQIFIEGVVLFKYICVGAV